MSKKERATYETLKSWALDAYYDGCRDYGISKGLPHAQIMGYVSHTFEDGFERPVEDLMWKVTILVLSGGLHAEWEVGARKVICDQLNQYGLDSLLADVPETEANVFRYDLQILKLI